MTVLALVFSSSLVLLSPSTCAPPVSSALALVSTSPQDEPALDLGRPRHVRALYLDTLGRTPDADELELAAGAPPRRLVALLTSSPEFWQHWYEDELRYFLLLDNFRPADPAPGERLPERLAAGTLDLPGAVREIVGGSAFHRANPGNDTFVSVVFEQLLGLVVQDEKALLDAGKRMYDGHRASLWGQSGSSQSDVVAIAVQRPAFYELLVERQYQRLVGRAPARDKQRAWAERLAQDGRAFADLVDEWLLSPAYAERLGSLRPKTDRQFLRGLMVDLTGKVPDAETLSRARAALAAVADGAPLRSVIARVLLARFGAGLPERGRVEASALVDDLYRRFLGRSPAPDERQAMVVLYVQCDAGPEVLARALITHREYQYY